MTDGEWTYILAVEGQQRNWNVHDENMEKEEVSTYHKGFIDSRYTGPWIRRIDCLSLPVHYVSELSAHAATQRRGRPPIAKLTMLRSLYLLRLGSSIMKSGKR
ncbi:hypothetical protein EVAR_8347_1 [Eumeta japonica]|uniref:Uncharacterized protein n=1 Tax=Eumeta variegata TaxID=151549 RepID=A0A4C1VEZ0_EUMVA|nr:hypothetical protein EVAR_8347_1 [Eumeta japonica]